MRHWARSSAVAHFTSLGTPYVVNTASGPRAYINQFSAENLQTFDSIRSEPAKQKTWAITPHRRVQERPVADRTAGHDLTGARCWPTRSSSTSSRTRIATSVPAGLNGITASVYTGGTDLSNFNIRLNTPNASHIPNGGYTLPSAANQATQAGAPMPGQAADHPGRPFRRHWHQRPRPERPQRRATGYRTQYRRLVPDRDPGRPALREQQIHLERLAQHLAWREYRQRHARHVAGEPLCRRFLRRHRGGYTSVWRSLNVDQVLGAITPVNTQPRTTANPNGLPGQFVIAPGSGVFLTPYGLVNNYWDPNYWNNNFTNQNDIFSVYGMAKFDGDIAGIRVRGNAGLRYEYTNNKIVALDCRNCSSALSVAAGPVNHVVAERTYRNDYGHLLPSFMMAADLSSKPSLRGAYYKTYVRPQPRDTVPITSVLLPEALTPAVDPVYNVTIGATNIQPYTADSFDMTLEWYNRPGGLFAVAVYQKNVKGHIGPITDQNVLCLRPTARSTGSIMVSAPCRSSARAASARTSSTARPARRSTPGC